MSRTRAQFSVKSPRQICRAKREIYRSEIRINTDARSSAGGIVVYTMQADIADRLRRAKISHHDTLARLAEMSFPIASRRTRSLPLGGSRFGGAPDVPQDFVWPRRSSRPLSFLAQIDLSEVEATELPRQGWLLFFYDVVEEPWGFEPDDASGARVIWLDVDRSSLKRARHPRVSVSAGVFSVCELAFGVGLDLPDAADRIVAASGVTLSAAERTRYQRALGIDDERPIHHLLGHPQLVQEDMRGECQLVTNGINCGDPKGYRGKRAAELLETAGADWKLLLQLDTDEAGPGWVWGDFGRLYFWIRRADLAMRAFDRAWVVLQCS